MITRLYKGILHREVITSQGVATHFDELNLIELADRIIDSVIHYERADLDGN